jgi:glycogen(starch) synthase
VHDTTGTKTIGIATIAPTTPQRVLMLSWLYPPLGVDGLGRHVQSLATSLVAAGHEVTVVTRHAPGAPLEEYIDGVRVVRTPEDPPLVPLSEPTLLTWTMAFNHALTRSALRAAQADRYDVIHAHDWLVTHTAVTLREHLDLPLVATIHATEAGRHQGWLPADANRSIHSIEWWLAHEAGQVITCSQYMRREVTQVLDVPAHRVEVVPEGVEAALWQAPPRAVAAARARYAGEGPLIGYAGRLAYDKGVQDLIAAMPRLRAENPGLRVVIAGDGPFRAELRAEIRAHKLQRAVSFAGFLSAGDLPALMAATDAMVVPSRYEPFGVVALEGASAGAPLAVATTGGLAEIVEPGVTGVTFPANCPDALADAVSTLLADEAFAHRVAAQARTMVAQRYGWDSVASRTAAVYSAARRDAPELAKQQAVAAMGHASPTIEVPDGNLLALERAVP